MLLRVPPQHSAFQADVSVVLSVKNEESYLESALLSILRQKGLELEVIVIDDASTDDTAAILSRMAAQDPRLRLFQNQKNGKVAAYNYGVSVASGEFVCIFAGDDLMPADSLAARWQAVKSGSATGPVVGLCKLVTLSADKRHDGQVMPRGRGRGALTGSSYLINRQALDSLFPVPEELPNEDTWLELAVSYLPQLKLVHSDVVGCAWRIHPGNSMNLLVDFDIFNDRLTRRMVAIEMFYNRNAGQLTSKGRQDLLGLMECEESRRRGSILGILRSRVGLVPKLRALSLSTKFFYGLRRTFYGLFSGW